MIGSPVAANPILNHRLAILPAPRLWQSCNITFREFINVDIRMSAVLENEERKSETRDDSLQA
jgi:hypothetical protein